MRIYKEVLGIGSIFAGRFYITIKVAIYFSPDCRSIC